MPFRLHRLRESSKIISRCFHSGIINQQLRRSTVFSSSSAFPLPRYWVKAGKLPRERFSLPKLIFRFSTMSEAEHQFSPCVDLLPFLESTLNELEGSSHCWLNKLEENEEPFSKNGVFLILAGVFTRDSLVFGSDHSVMLERVKLLQRRHPHLRILGFQSGSSVCSATSRTHTIQTIMKHYITFPVLLSTRAFSEVVDEPGYFIFKDFKGPFRYFEKTTELGVVNNSIEELSSLNQNEVDQNLKETEIKKPGVTAEPYVSSLRNLLLYSPGCISVDEYENRIFLSDSNHHRIIIFDGNGKILDCIGSSPGFEDGDFDSAKLLRPAASVYHAEEDCLYFVDSENCAIRRADIGGRTVETLYPTIDADKKVNSTWRWILSKLGMGGEVASGSEELDLESSIVPWHLMKNENNFLIINPSFQTLWIMDATSRKVTDIVTDYPEIMEICGETITEKRSLLNRISSRLQHRADLGCSLEGYPHDSLMSSVVVFDNNILFCDTDAQTILKLDKESGVISELQLSNFGILGLPYWLYCCPLERVFVGGDTYQKPAIDHFQSVSLLPGKCEIHLNVHIPEGTELAAPLQEGSIWRQARGSAVEISGSEEVATSSEKVGIAQQWFEELDNLAFSTEELNEEDDKSRDVNFHEDSKVQIDCAVNISPGTSEVIVYGVLYLKLNRNLNYHGSNTQEEKAKRILDMLNQKEESRELEKDARVQLMLESKRDMGEVIFMKPLHIRIGIECQDNPKAGASKDVILTDSKIEVNVSLR